MPQPAKPFDMTTQSMMDQMNQTQKWLADMAKSAPASPMMTQPMAGAAAATALSFGAASQMMGFFIGSVQGAMECSRRMGMPVDVMDMTAFYKAFDPDWRAGFGKAAAEAAQETALKTQEAAGKIVADAADNMKKTSAETGAAAKVMEDSSGQAIAAASEMAASATKAAAVKAKQAESVSARSMTRAKDAGQQRPAGKRPEASAPPKASARPSAEMVKTQHKTAMARPKSVAKPERADDLKAISGIGPKLEEVLNRLGVWTFAQIADWTPPEIAWVDDYLQFSGRIERDDWIRQAAAAMKTATATGDKPRDKQ